MNKALIPILSLFVSACAAHHGPLPPVAGKTPDGFNKIGNASNDDLDLKINASTPDTQGKPSF